MKYPHIAARLFNQPLLIESGKLSTIVAALGPRFDPDRDWGMVDPVHSRQTVISETGYTITDGVAIIPVIGTLVHRGSTPDAMSGLTGYDALSEWLQAALINPEVKAIMLDIDSPGGEVAGAFDFADEIFAARGQKPIVSMVADRAASGGYLIASSADEVVTTRTGMTGSVGVVTAHLDFSKAVENEGVVITHIYAGAHKVDGHSYAPLPDDVRGRIQGDINKLYDLFTQTIERNRGIPAATVRATEALVYMGGAAVEIGFADKVSTREATLASMIRSINSGKLVSQTTVLSRKSKENRMEKDDANNNPVTGITEQQMNSAVIQARTDERARIRAIMQSDTAAGRAEMADHLAFETDMEATSAIALLGKAPVASATTAPAVATSALAKAMAAIEQPNISASDVGDDKLPDNSPRAAANVIISDFKRAKGKGS